MPCDYDHDRFCQKVKAAMAIFCGFREKVLPLQARKMKIEYDDICIEQFMDLFAGALSFSE